VAWIKKGKIFNPAGNRVWNKSHAQVPVAVPLDNKLIRIFYGTRDANNCTLTSYVDVDADDPGRIVYEHDDVILQLGKPGTFDDCGVMPSWVVVRESEWWMYYIGWTVRNTVPYHNSIGLAVSSDQGKTFRRYSDGPLFSPTVSEPYFTGTSCVLRKGGIWHNWYLSCTEWRDIKGRQEPVYHIKYAQSDDGIHWTRDGKIAIDYQSANEGGIVKASVVIDSGLFKMWYAFRQAADYRTDANSSYRIGYAESDDGENWQRLDHLAGIDVSPTGWDSMMVTYPHVIDIGEHRYMFYNGNGFGQSGFGYALWSD